MAVNGDTTKADGALDHPDVIAHPPILYLGFLIAGSGLEFLWPVPLVPAALGYGAGGLLAAIGIAIMAAALVGFRRAGTSVRPVDPTTALVTDGIFRFSRNPIYVGMSLIYAGLGLVVNGAWVLALLVPLLVIVRYGVIAREERYLEGKFGQAYRQYKGSTRRWL